MKITLTKQGLTLYCHNEESEEKLNKLSDAIYEIDIKNLDMRTVAQNRALHLWCKQISEALNAANIYMQGVFKSEIEWDMTLVKEVIIKRTIKKVFSIDSTTKLKRKELDQMIDFIVLALASSIEVPEFPNKQLWDEKKEIK